MLLHAIRTLREWFASERGVHPFRPVLEAFEDRCLPSVLLVSNLKDAGVGSLRRAIAKANTTAAPDVIEFAPALKGTIKLKSGEFNVTRDLNIKGPGVNKLVLSGADISRIFNV